MLYVLQAFAVLKGFQFSPIQDKALKPLCLCAQS